MQADQFLLRVAQPGHHRVVGVQDLAILIQDKDEIIDGVEEPPQVFFAFLQGLDSHSAVQGRPDDPGRRPQGLGLGRHPGPFGQAVVISHEPPPAILREDRHHQQGLDRLLLQNGAFSFREIPDISHDDFILAQFFHPTGESRLHKREVLQIGIVDLGIDLLPGPFAGLAGQQVALGIAVLAENVDAAAFCRLAKPGQRPLHALVPGKRLEKLLRGETDGIEDRIATGQRQGALLRQVFGLLAAGQQEIQQQRQQQAPADADIGDELGLLGLLPHFKGQLGTDLHGPGMSGDLQWMQCLETRGMPGPGIIVGIEHPHRL